MPPGLVSSAHAGAESLAPVNFWWHDGGDPKPDRPYDHDGSNKPPKVILTDIQELMDKVPGSGCLLLGDKGKLFSPDAYGAQFFVSCSKGGRNSPTAKATKR